MTQLNMKIFFLGLLLVTGPQSPLWGSGCSSSSARRPPVSFTAQMACSVGEAPRRCEQLSSGCVREAEGLGSGKAEKDPLPNLSLLTSSKGQSCSHNQRPYCKRHVKYGSGGKRWPLLASHSAQPSVRLWDSVVGRRAWAFWETLWKSSVHFHTESFQVSTSLGAVDICGEQCILFLGFLKELSSTLWLRGGSLLFYCPSTFFSPSPHPLLSPHNTFLPIFFFSLQSPLTCIILSPKSILVHHL